MTTPVNNNGSSAGSGSTAIGTNGEVSNLFTTLLVAQIKNQNPLEPTDPSAFVNQLTQLSQMEALQKLQNQGESNAAALNSMQMLSLGAQVGTKVQARVEQIQLGKDPIQAGFTLASSASPATLVLTDVAGAERRIELGQRAIGRHDLTLDAKALGLAEGKYQVRIENEMKQATALEVVAELSSVRLDGRGGAVLSLAGMADISPADITAFLGRSVPATH